MGLKDNGKIELKIIVPVIVVILVIIGSVVYLSSEGEAPPVVITTIKIGWVGDFTGFASTYGIPGRYGAEWALEKLDEIYPDGFEIPGQENRYKIEYVYADWGGVLDEWAMCVKRLLDQGVVAIISDLASFVDPVLPDLREEEVVLFSWLDPSPGFLSIDKDPLIFRYRNEQDQTILGMAEFFVEELGLKNFVFLNNTDPGSDYFSVPFLSIVEPAGGNLLKTEFYSVGDMDFSIQLSNLKIPEAEFLLANAATTMASMAIKQAIDMGYTMPFATYTGMTEVQAEALIGSNYAQYVEGVYQTEGVDAFTHPDPAIRQWGMDYLERFGEYPIDLVMWTWDITFVMVEAIQNAGTDTDSGAIADALLNVPHPFNNTELWQYVYTPSSPIDGKLFDEQGGTRIDVQICGWENGCKLPLKYYTVDGSTRTIISEEYPPSELWDQLIEEFNERRG